MILLIPLLIKKIENIIFKKLIKPLIIIMDPQYQIMKNIWHMEVMTSY